MGVIIKHVCYNLEASICWSLGVEALHGEMGGRRECRMITFVCMENNRFES